MKMSILLSQQRTFFFNGKKVSCGRKLHQKKLYVIGREMPLFIIFHGPHVLHMVKGCSAFYFMVYAVFFSPNFVLPTVFKQIKASDTEFKKLKT